jgi:hypothetical protein
VPIDFNAIEMPHASEIQDPLFLPNVGRPCERRKALSRAVIRKILRKNHSSLRISVPSLTQTLNNRYYPLTPYQ